MSWKDHVRCYSVGHLETNCYLLEDDGACLVVDPGSSGSALAREVPEGAVVTIVATHGHHDHVGGIAALKRATDAKFLISKGDAERAQHAIELSSHVFDVSDGELEDAPPADGHLVDGDVVRIGSRALRVIALMQTIQRLKKEIPPQTVLLCGHGPATTMANEIAYNPFFS